MPDPLIAFPSASTAFYATDNATDHVFNALAQMIKVFERGHTVEFPSTPPRITDGAGKN